MDNKFQLPKISGFQALLEYTPLLRVCRKCEEVVGCVSEGEPRMCRCSENGSCPNKTKGKIKMVKVVCPHPGLCILK